MTRATKGGKPKPVPYRDMMNCRRLTEFDSETDRDKEHEKEEDSREV